MTPQPTHALPLPSPDHLVDMLARGMRIANAAIVSDIESECARWPAAGDAPACRWYDTRPMLDRREHCDDVVEMATQALQWGLDMGLLQRHPRRAYLVGLPPKA